MRAAQPGGLTMHLGYWNNQLSVAALGEAS